MTTHELTIGGTEVTKGDTVTVTALKDGEEATAELEITGGYKDAEELVVGMQGQSVGSLSAKAPIGSHREDAEVVGSLNLDHEEGIVRPVTNVEVA